MKGLLFSIAIALIFHTENLSAQVTITNFSNTTPALADAYTSLADAITDLQAITAISGPVTITLTGNNPETAPAGGYVISFATTTTLSTPIVIEGNNNIITAALQPVGSSSDAIFKIVGADYITIRGFTMQENLANTSMTPIVNTMTEWGVALLNASVSNGAQHNTIQNNTISLNRDYPNSFGIYSNTNHSLADVGTDQPIINDDTAPNHNNKIYSNTISNVNMGIAFIGSAVANNMDVGNDIGGSTVSTGNNISNWGGKLSATFFFSNPSVSYGILVNHQKDENVSNNVLTSATVTGTAVALTGILKDYSITTPTGTFISNIKKNTITIKNNFTTATSFECINSRGIITPLNTVTINIDSNYIFQNDMGNAVTPIGSEMTGIINSSVCGTLNMTRNIFRENTMTTPNAAFTGISNLALVTNVININGNKFGDALGNCLTLPAGSWNRIGAVWCKRAGLNASLSISGNNIEGFNHSGAGSNPYYFIYFEHEIASAVTDNFNNNTFTNLYINTNEIVFGIIRNGGNMQQSAGATMNYNNNKVVGVFSKPYPGQYAAGVLFIDNYGGSERGNYTNFIGNDFSNVNVQGETGDLLGIWSADGGSVTTFSNNIFQNWNYGGHWARLIGGSGADTTYITNNTIKDITGASAFLGLSIDGDSLIVCRNNSITNIETTIVGGSEMIGISSVSSNIKRQFITNNIIENISSSKGAMTAGIRIGNAVANTTDVSVNRISNLSSSHISASTLVVGIDITAVASGVHNIYNNIIGDLRSTNTNNANAVRGINISSVVPGAAHNIYYNTIYLDAPASTGTNFGTSGIYATADATTTNGLLTLRNNIVVNLSAVNGGGITAVFRRSASTLANYSPTSNNNIFYAGTPSATNVMLRYATTSFQTLAAYKTKVSPADANSFTELPPFLNITTGANPDYLHINGTIPTQAESGAINIIGIEDDIDAEIRQGNTGYIGTGTSPDIGADEFEGFIIVPVSITTISASRNNDKTIVIKWKGENEINLDRYFLERSANGQNFEMIGSKDPVANNGGTATYQYNDLLPFTGNNFYRIKSISIGGRIQYSAVVKVGPLNETGSITVYPNPVKDKILNIRFVNQPAGIYKLQLTNKLGQWVYNSNIEIADNNNTKTITLSSDLVPGYYLLSIVSANSEKFVQQILVR